VPFCLATRSFGVLEAHAFCACKTGRHTKHGRVADKAPRPYPSPAGLRAVSLRYSALNFAAGSFFASEGLISSVRSKTFIVVLRQPNGERTCCKTARQRLRRLNVVSLFVEGIIFSISSLTLDFDFQRNKVDRRTIAEKPLNGPRPKAYDSFES
jgi:hypothetical protein